MTPILKERYDSQVKANLQKQFSFDNAMQLPRLQKIVVNMGVGDAKEDSKLMDAAVRLNWL